MIELKSISKVYNPGLFKAKIRAVSDLSLTIRQGEVFGLIGPNGAGKSSTIRMLLKLIKPDSGSITFQGKPIWDLSLQKDIGYLPENPYLYDHLTLLELLTFCGKSSGLEKKQIAASAMTLMEKLNLLDARKRPLRTFSKGMLQRAGICFALLHNPSIVILDEPMSGLDPVGRKMVFDLIMELKNNGKTVFLCSHILNDVERLCDRIGIMNKGHLVRAFERRELMQVGESSIFLQTQKLLQTQILKLESMGCSCREHGNEMLIALTRDGFYEVTEHLQSVGVRVLGCRSEWVSLEDLFMQTIKG